MKDILNSGLEKLINGIKGIGKVLRRLLPEIILNALLPFFIYLIMKSVLRQSELISLLATAVPSALNSIMSIIRTRRINFVAGVVLLGIVIGLLTVLLSNDPRFLLLRGSFFTAAFGLAFLISLLFPKPLSYYVARMLEAGEDAERLQNFASKWDDPLFRTNMRAQAVIWSMGLLVETAVRVPLLFSVTTEQFLAISPILMWSVVGTTFAVSRAWVHLLQRQKLATQK